MTQIITVEDWSYSSDNFVVKKIKIRPTNSILYSEVECYIQREGEVYRVYPKDRNVWLGVSLFEFNPKTQSYFPKTGFENIQYFR